MTLKNILYIPKLCFNILSLRQLDEQGFKTIIKFDELLIYDQGRCLLTTIRKTQSQIYLLTLNIVRRCFVAIGKSELAWI